MNGFANYFAIACSAGFLAGITSLCSLNNSAQAEQPATLPAKESPYLTPQTDPPGLTEYKGRQIAVTMHWQGAPWLQRATREEEERASVMREQLGIKPGLTVCDLGSGDGYHTLWMAEKVGPMGKVYAVDVQQEMLDLLEPRLKAKGHENVKLVLGKYWDPLLPDASQDLILLVDVYHEFSHPEHMLKAMRKALKPEGTMVLVEFRTEDPKVPIKPEHKMSKEQMAKEIPPMGFKLVKEFDELPWQHMMFYQKAEEASPAAPKQSP
jgi:ubiquinone/menaquinone biosynthesis C-methylase UbiE